MEPSYRVYYPDGTQSGRIEGSPSVEEVEKEVGGSIETVGKTDQYIMVVNENWPSMKDNPFFPQYKGTVVFVFNCSDWLT